MKAFTVSHNAFIDRQHFKPDICEKLYDCVYLGSSRPQKRLSLASLVNSNMLLLTCGDEYSRNLPFSVKDKILDLEIESIPTFLSRAHCGLILSESEGGCYASTEYLYCGVPVVSTFSEGGREAYYDDVTALIVSPDPISVNLAVEEIKKRNIDPWEIRRRALKVTDGMLDTLAYEIFQPIFKKYKNKKWKKVRLLVDEIINKTNSKSSKGRTLFQPENPTHNSIEKILGEMN